jgi:hypothetical protein
MPTSVTMGEEELQQPEDTPLITICQDPSINIRLQEDYFCKGPGAPLYQWIGNRPSPPRCDNVNILHFSVDMLTALSAMNISMDEYLKKAGLPLLEVLDSCSQLLGRSIDSPNGCLCLSNCGMRNYNSSEPIVHQTEVGRWETRLYWDGLFSGIRLCSTLQLNVSIEVGLDGSFDLKTKLLREQHYQLTSRT